MWSSSAKNARRSHGCQITVVCFLIEPTGSPNRFKMNRLGETLKNKVVTKRTGEESSSCMQECFRIKQGLNEKQQKFTAASQ